jgi:hypothetical protein
MTFLAVIDSFSLRLWVKPRTSKLARRLRFGRSLTLPTKKSRLSERCAKLVGRAKLRLSRNRGCPGIFCKNLVSLL